MDPSNGHTRPSIRREYALVNGALYKRSSNETYMYVNNRLEGNAILTIASFLARFPDLFPSTPKKEGQPDSAGQPLSAPRTEGAKDQLQLGI